MYDRRSQWGEALAGCDGKAYRLRDDREVLGSLMHWQMQLMNMFQFFYHRRCHMPDEF